MNDTLSWLRLHLTPGLGRSGLFHLIRHFGSPGAALQALPDRWQQRSGVRADLARLVPAADDPRVVSALERFEACAAWLLSFWDPDYPAPLKQIPDPPALLYGRGAIPAGDMLAIVGSRKPTPVGRQLAESLAEQLAGQGVAVVSGLARGIDTAAHRGVLNAGGVTFGVLGCGIDQVYPPEHEQLYRQLLERGGLLSEYPPGTAPLPGHFPGRNRIISGLAQGTLVIEAAAGSGSLITVEFALEQGREVFAVPGGIDRPVSAGTNQLIKDGAHPVTEAIDILQRLWPERLCQPRPRNVQHPPTDLSEPARNILCLLGLEPLHVDELAGKSGLTPMELSVILLQLELQGGVEQLPGARYIRGRKPLTDINRSIPEST